jgi:hypothetical protein
MPPRCRAPCTEEYPKSHPCCPATIITSNRPLDDWPKLLGDAVVVTPPLDRLMHHGHLLKFKGKSWRLKEAASRIAKDTAAH